MNGIKRLALGALAFAAGLTGEATASSGLAGSFMLTSITHGASRFIHAADPQHSYGSFFFLTAIGFTGFRSPKIWSLSLTAQPGVNSEVPEYSNNRGGVVTTSVTASQPEGPLDQLQITIKPNDQTTTPDFELQIATDQLGIPLQVGNYPDPSANPTAGQPTFQLTYGTASWEPTGL
ncbi:MAG: hypothetical protein EXR86_01510 [Gammaproteobacteria bacterium]|nr:hypothetical protein [Gammaproteobacteria bacterium]